MRSSGSRYVLLAVAVLGFLPIVTARGQDDDPVAHQDYLNKQACDTTGLCNNPPPGTNGGARAPNYFAAIVFSYSTGNSGSSHGQTSQAAADQVAMSNCAGRATDCKLLVQGENVCLGLAVGAGNLSGWAVNGTRDGAQAAALKQCQLQAGKSCVIRSTPCAGDDVHFSSPLPFPAAGTVPVSPVDKATVGTWHLNVNQGIWVWQIAANGTFTIYSQAVDNEQSTAGTFTSDGKNWSMHGLNNGITDGGAYHFDAQGNFIATGKLGTGTWVRAGR